MASLLAGQLHVFHKLDSKERVSQVCKCNGCLQSWDGFFPILLYI